MASRSLPSISTDFKKLNDVHGHACGDKMLRVVARRLTKLFPQDLVFRLGGDEFVVVAAASSTPNPADAGLRIRGILSEPVSRGAAHVEVGASVGFASCPQQCSSLVEAAHCAAIAMYAAKQLACNNVLAFNDCMRETLVDRTRLEDALRAAVRSGAIEPYYEPLVQLKTGDLVGFEGLARWKRDDGTMVDAGSFIPIAEGVGLIAEIFEQLLARACSDALQWPSHIRLALNLSPGQLTDKLIGLRIVRTLNKVGFPAHRLELEITESALIFETETAVQILKDLHDAGVRIALDDFGTGYSSLSHLAKFQFDRIKIDQSFVQSFETDKKQNKIVRAIVTLGAGLGVSTTAEGIEKESQRLGLQALGCQHGQGYLFGKAMPAREALDLINSRRPMLNIVKAKTA